MAELLPKIVQSRFCQISVSLAGATKLYLCRRMKDSHTLSLPVAEPSQSPVGGAVVSMCDGWLQTLFEEVRPARLHRPITAGGGNAILPSNRPRSGLRRTDDETSRPESPGVSRQAGGGCEHMSKNRPAALRGTLRLQADMCFPLAVPTQRAGQQSISESRRDSDQKCGRGGVTGAYFLSGRPFQEPGRSNARGH